MRHISVPGTCLIISLALALSHFAPAQTKELTADESIPIPKVEFDAQGELKLTASPNSSPNDFDFLTGQWKMHNRHLDKRLANCRTWVEFESSDVNTKILNGTVDMDNILDHAVSRNGRQTFRRSHLAIIRPEDTTLESLLDRQQHGKYRSSRRRFVRPKRRRPFFWQRHAQWQTDPRRLPLGCAEQRPPCLGSGLFTR